MKIKRFLAFSSGLTIGYLAGTAAGRERFHQIRTGASAVEADLGLTRVSEHLRPRSGEFARASVDRVAESTCDGIDITADKLETLLVSDGPHIQDHSGRGPDLAPSVLTHANGSHHTKHKDK
jgi:hypothetical protein